MEAFADLFTTVKEIEETDKDNEEQREEKRRVKRRNAENAKNRSFLLDLGKHLANDTSYGSGRDLMHECLCRALDGKRFWPLDIDFTHFLFQSMRSVAGADRKRHSTSRTLSITIEAAEESLTAPIRQPSVEEEAITREEMLTAANAVDRARRLFTGDAEARRVLDGMVAGKTPFEMRIEFSMTDREFKTVRLRVSRALARTRSLDRRADLPARSRAAQKPKAARRVSPAATTRCEINRSASGDDLDHAATPRSTTRRRPAC